MKRLALAVTACTAIAVPAALTNATAQTGQPTTLELVQLERDVRDAFVDNPPRRRESAGDVFIVSGRVRDTAGRPVGRASAVFTQTSRSSAQGAATFVLANGQIVVEGRLAGSGADTFAVVGGTGAYAGATGTARITEGRRRTEFTFTLDG
jgi:dirigent-like protein